MRKVFWLVIALCLVAGIAVAQYGAPAETKPTTAKPDFAITASYIEACSCDMFCPCYFNDHSTAHGNAHFCKANLVLKVDKGYYKTTRLDGVKAWVTTDLGSEWAKGKADWLVVTFEPSITKEQQAAMTDILFQLYPMKFNVLGVDKVPFAWEIKGDTARARLENGKGEVILERWKGDDAKKEVVIHNLKYWSAQSNTGFRMWKNKRHYYEGHGQKFEFNGTNGFLITINFSGQAKPAAAD
jgi:hypothetical protein